MADKENRIFEIETEIQKGSRQGILAMVRHSLNGILLRTKIPVADLNQTAEDISSQIIIEVLSREIDCIEKLRIRIGSLCYEELDYRKRNYTGQDYVSDEGKKTNFEGPREGVGDLRKLEDVCEGMEFRRELLSESELKESDDRDNRIKEQYSYLIQELYIAYQNLDHGFYRKFFDEWLIEGKNRKEISKMIREKGGGFISSRRVGQCKRAVVQQMSEKTGTDYERTEALLLSTKTVLEKLSELEKNPPATLGDMFVKVGIEATEFHNFGKADLSQIPIPSDVARRKIDLPKLIKEEDAKKKKAEAILRLEEQLETFNDYPERFCRGEPQPLFPHQHRKLDAIAQHLKGQFTDDSEAQAFMADIAPPSAGKTYMQAVLAKLSGLPFVFVTYSNSIIYGDDGAYKGFSKLFSEDELGIVNYHTKEFGRQGTLTTYHSFANPDTLRELLIQPKDKTPLLFLLDEGDLAQAETRKNAIQAIQESLHHPIICAFSATQESGGKKLGDTADIVDEMELRELIELGKAKHILGFYVNSQTTVTDDNLAVSQDGRHVRYEMMREGEKDAFTSIPVELVLENHQGQQGIIHCMSVEHAEEVAKLLRQNGVESASISGSVGTKARRQREVTDKYMHGEIDVITSCDVLGRGYSEHGITDFVIFAHVTSSKTELYQKIGRGFRPNPDNNVLAVYQLMPTAIRANNFTPATLGNIFPIEYTQDIEGGSVYDMTESLNELIEKGEIGFIGSVGQQPDSTRSMTFMSQKEVKQIIDTREEWGDRLKLDEDNIDELFDHIMDGFSKVLGEGDGWIGGGKAFIQTESVINGKKINGATFCRKVTGILCQRSPEEIPYYLSLGAILIKKWHVDGERPDRDFIFQQLNNIEKRKAETQPSLKLNDSNVDELFFPLINTFIESAELNSYEEINSSNIQMSVSIEEGKISSSTFIYRVVASCTGMTMQEAHHRYMLGIQLIKEWCRIGKMPSQEFIDKEVEKDNERRVDKQPQEKLDLDESNIDELFFPIMEAYIKKTEVDSCEALNTHNIRTTIIVNGGAIHGKMFIEEVIQACTGMTKKESKKSPALGIKLAKEWYRTGGRPDPDFVDEEVRKDEEVRAKRQSTKKLEINEGNIDQLLPSIVNAFVEKAGINSFEDLNTSNIRTKAFVGGQEVSGKSFLSYIVHICTGMDLGQARSRESLALELIKEWYRTGERPSRMFINEKVAEYETRKKNKIRLTDENIDKMFFPVVETFMRELNLNDVEHFTTSALMAEVMVDGKYPIKGGYFLNYITHICTGISLREANANRALGIEMLKEWYRTGKRPNKEFAEEKKEAFEGKIIRSAKTIRLRDDNVDLYFFDIVNGINEMSGNPAGDIEWLNVNLDLMRKHVTIDDKVISIETFINSVVRILCDLPHKKAVKMKTVGVELIKEWSRTGERPSEEFIEEKMSVYGEKRASFLSLSQDNIDDYFQPIIESFMSEAGINEGDFEGMNTGTFMRREVKIDEQVIKGQRFLATLVSTCCGVQQKEAASFSNLGVEIAKEWSRTGERPSQEFIDKHFVQAQETSEKRKQPKVQLNEENMDELFLPITNGFSEAMGIDPADAKFNAGQAFVRTEIEVDGEAIKGGYFLKNIIRTLCDVKPEDDWKYLSLGKELIREWYETGEKPSEEFVRKLMEDQNSRLEMRNLPKLELTEDNIDDLFEEIIDGFGESVENKENLKWMSTNYRKFLGRGIVIDNQLLRAHDFVERVIVLLTDIESEKEAVSNRGLGIKLIKEWYRTGKRPSQTFIDEKIKQKARKNKI